MSVINGGLDAELDWLEEYAEESPTEEGLDPEWGPDEAVEAGQEAVIDFPKALKKGSWDAILNTPSAKPELVALQQRQELSRALFLLDPARHCEQDEYL